MKKLFLIVVFFVTPVFALEKNDALIFLEKKVPSEVLEKFSEAIERNDNKTISFIIEHDGVVYSLYSLKALKSKNQSIQNSLNASAMSEAYIAAATDLAFYLDDGNIKLDKFENKNALKNTIRISYEAKIKFNSVGRMLNGKAYYLVWSDRAKKPLSESELNENYCKFLYEQALRLFDEKKFFEALEAFHQIHYMSWANIASYLGASKCFLYMNQKDDAIKLTSELVNVFSKDMTADEMAEAGKILFNAGQKDEGFNTLELAYEILKSK